MVLVVLESGGKRGRARYPLSKAHLSDRSVGVVKLNYPHVNNGGRATPYSSTDITLERERGQQLIRIRHPCELWRKTYYEHFIFYYF